MPKEKDSKSKLGKRRSIDKRGTMELLDDIDGEDNT